MTAARSRNSAKYTRTAQYLHWLVAAGIVLQFVLGERAEEAADTGQLQSQLAALASHKSIGISILSIVFLRLVWRWFHQPPPLPAHYVATHQTLAHLASVAHIALYTLLLVLPVSGWLMSSASAYSVSWFNLVQLPDLIGPSESAKDLWATVHDVSAKLLFVLAVIHIVAAVKHLLWDRDDVMQRMATPLPLLAFVGCVALGLWMTAEAAPASSASSPVTPSNAITPEVRPKAGPKHELAPKAEQVAQATSRTPPERATTLPSTPKASPLPRWQIDHQDSFIRFVATQAGAEFTGQFARFDAEIYFAASQLQNSRATVTIDAASIATEDAERDSTLAGDDWFDSNNFAEVTFSATTFTHQNADLTAHPHPFSTLATLNVRGVDYAVPFHFSVTTLSDKTVLEGTARLDRMALNLGTREWADTDWVGQYVDVSVRVVAKP